MATALDVIIASLKEIGVLAAGETPTADDSSDGFIRLNRFVNTCAAENLTIPAVTRTLATLTANQASFTVGTGGNINIARPVFIEKVNFVDTSTDPDTEYPLGDLLTEQAWASIPLKALTGVFPTAAYYSPTYPTGTLYPWPIPTSATLQWAVYAWTAVSQFAALTTVVSLPPAYEEMLMTNLALLSCPTYEKQPHPVLVKRATDTMATLKRANRRLVDQSFGADVPGVGGHGSWDIRMGP